MAFDPRLGKLFVFSPEDLAANNAGHLSAEQRTMVAAAIRGTRRGLTRGRLIVTVAVLAAGVAAVAMSRSPGGGGGGTTPILLAAAILVVLFIAVRIPQRRGSRRMDAMASAEMRTADGPFTWTNTLDGDWVGTVGDAHFSVDTAHVGVLDTGGTFRVHYLPWREKLAWVMSIERIEDA